MPGRSDGFFPDERFSQPDTAFSGGTLKSFLGSNEAEIERPKQQPSANWKQTPTGWKLIVVRDDVTREYFGPTDELLKIARRVV